LCASSALARRSFPTTITHEASTPVGVDGTFVDSGYVSSPNHRCEFFRVVTLIGHYPSGREKLLDIDLTSFLGGAWATRADLTGTDLLKARVRRSSFRRHGHRKVCRADSVAFPPPAL
jgi:hypothetical protein